MNALQRRPHLDMVAVQRYLRGVRAVADEALKAEDPRVVLLALQVLERDTKRLPERALKVMPLRRA